MVRPIAELVELIGSMHDSLDATASEAEAIGMAPPHLVDDMRIIRVPLIKAPAEVGGDHLLLADQCRFFDALAYANPTAAWTGFNHAGAAGMAGAKLDDAGVAALFGTDPVPFMAAVSAPTGTFVRVEGGIVLRGTWRYASGVRHADWVMVTALERDAAGRPGVRLAVLRTADVDVHGTWDVMALKGTGSVDVTANDLFVPDALTIDPTVPPRRGGPMYTLGYQAYVAGENLGFTFGVCRRFVDELVAYARSKSRGPDGSLASRGAFQYELGRSTQQLEAARAHALTTLGQADEAFTRDGSLSSAAQRHIGAMLAFCTESSVEAITRLMGFAGAGALFESSPLQRCFRDAHGSAQHLMASTVAYDRQGTALLEQG